MPPSCSGWLRRGTALPGTRSQEDGWQHVGDHSRLLQTLGSFCHPFLSVSLFFFLFNFLALLGRRSDRQGFATPLLTLTRVFIGDQTGKEWVGRTAGVCFVCPNCGEGWLGCGIWDLGFGREWCISTRRRRREGGRGGWRLPFTWSFSFVSFSFRLFPTTWDWIGRRLTQRPWPWYLYYHKAHGVMDDSELIHLQGPFRSLSTSPLGTWDKSRLIHYNERARVWTLWCKKTRVGCKDG